MIQKTITHSLLTEFDISLFKAGKHYRLYEKLGSHIIEVNGSSGVYFAVYAPGAQQVAVIGNFNHWTGEQHRLNVRWDGSGIWEGFIPGLQKGELYKYKIWSNQTDEVLEKGDPFAHYWEQPPRTSSIVWDTDHEWRDDKWMIKRESINRLDQPMSIYEVHLGSWKKKEGNRFLTYGELAEELVKYVKKMRFTHVEFMPVMEHPYDPSWGYQVTGYYAPTSRFGNPHEFIELVEAFHDAGIGVILDWVPAHFPEDKHGLAKFDGTHVYEHPDKRRGYHPDWKSLIFNYGRNEVKSFLISNAIFWLDKFHVDGLRVDAVASMIYLDYSRNEGEWEPNIYGGNENLEAISLIKELNEEAYRSFPGIQTIAEESTSFTGVSKPTYTGGLGFGLKWMMGWMNDTLEYFKKDPYYRQFHQNEITFSLTYAFTENFMLPLSHDEVVHGKGSMLGKMPGDEWQRFANLRVLYAYMFTHPGSKLLFMGCEFAQSEEWKHNSSLDWHLLQYDYHKGVQALIKELNRLYRKEKAFFEKGYSPTGFEWIDYSDSSNSVIAYLRKGNSDKHHLLVVCNLTPVIRKSYRLGVPESNSWKTILNTDEEEFGGSGVALEELIKVDDISSHGRSHSIDLTLPPLAVIVLKKGK